MIELEDNILLRDTGPKIIVTSFLQVGTGHDFGLSPIRRGGKSPFEVLHGGESCSESHFLNHMFKRKECWRKGFRKLFLILS